MAFALRMAEVRDVSEDLDEGTGCGIMIIDLVKGFWFMGGVPGKQAPRGTKPFNSFGASFATPFRKLNSPAHRGQQLTPALTLPQVRYGLSLLLLEVFCTPSIDYICRQVHRQLMRNELARFYHHCTRKCMPPRKLRRDIQ